MKFFCITFFRQYDDDNTEHKYFCHALNEEDAKQRFCVTSGYKSSCIVSVHIMRQEKMKWEHL